MKHCNFVSKYENIYFCIELVNKIIFTTLKTSRTVKKRY